MSNRDVLPELLSDLRDRVEIRGMKTYGRPMTTGDGRDGLLDAYEEALDLCCYLKKVLMEREDAGLPNSTLIERRARPFSAACEAVPAHESGVAGCLVSLRCESCLREQCVC